MSKKWNARLMKQDGQYFLMYRDGTVSKTFDSEKDARKFSESERERLRERTPIEKKVESYERFSKGEGTVGDSLTLGVPLQGVSKAKEEIKAKKTDPVKDINSKITNLDKLLDLDDLTEEEEARIEAERQRLLRGLLNLTTIKSETPIDTTQTPPKKEGTGVGGKVDELLKMLKGTITPEETNPYKILKNLSDVDKTKVNKRVNELITEDPNLKKKQRLEKALKELNEGLLND
tara:strand:+ start:1941 stop:2639 length:699 start_codon:yes stop_codon:yes gene_type:complete